MAPMRQPLYIIFFCNRSVRHAVKSSLHSNHEWRTNNDWMPLIKWIINRWNDSLRMISQTNVEILLLPIISNFHQTNSCHTSVTRNFQREENDVKRNNKEENAVKDVRCGKLHCIRHLPEEAAAAAAAALTRSILHEHHTHTRTKNKKNFCKFFLL